MNVDLLISLLIALASHAGEVSALISNARAQKRDITDDELRAVFDKDAIARAKFTLDIAAARAAGK